MQLYWDEIFVVTWNWRKYEYASAELQQFNKTLSGCWLMNPLGKASGYLNSYVWRNARWVAIERVIDILDIPKFQQRSALGSSWFTKSFLQLMTSTIMYLFNGCEWKNHPKPKFTLVGRCNDISQVGVESTNLSIISVIDCDYWKSLLNLLVMS